MPSPVFQSIRHYFAVFIGALVLISVVMLAAFFSMRVAIHGREVEVPNLAGRSDADAAGVTRELGLNLSVENRFYSPTVAPNHVLSQLPTAGSRVRRGWQVRVTESLGPQVVSVPDVLGQNERPASLVMRRLQLDLATVAHLPAPSPSDIVLAQSPPPNSKGTNGPRVALLVSDDERTAQTAAFVMPSITGLSLTAASLRLASAGLHVGSVESPQNNSDATPATDSAAPEPYIPPPTVSATATITSQSPLPGHRVTRADNIRVMLSN